MPKDIAKAINIVTSIDFSKYSFCFLISPLATKFDILGNITAPNDPTMPKHVPNFGHIA